MAEEASESASASTESASSSSSPAGALDAAIAKAVAMGNEDDGPEEVAVAAEPAKPAAVAKGKKPTGRRVEALESKSVEKAEAEPAAPAEDLAAKARYHLQHGDVAKAIESAFGNLTELGAGMPDAVKEALARKLGVGSANWEKLRKHETNAKREVAAREQKLQGIANQLQSEYASLHEAKQAYQAGDYDKAFKAAFGEDAVSFQRKLIGERVGKNPEVEALKAQIEADKAERRAEQQRYQQAQQQAQEQQQVAAYQANLQSELSSSEDPAIAKYSTRPHFVAQVFEVLRANYDPDTGVTVPVHVAAEHVRDSIQASLQQWQLDHPGQVPAQSAQAAAMPAKPPARAVRTLKQTGAAEATGQPRKLSPEEIRAKHQRLMELLPAET